MMEAGQGPAAVAEAGAVVPEAEAAAAAAEEAAAADEWVQVPAPRVGILSLGPMVWIPREAYHEMCRDRAEEEEEVDVPVLESSSESEEAN